MKEYIFDFRAAVRKSTSYIDVDDYSEFVENFMWKNNLWGRDIYNELMAELKELELS